MIHQSRYSLPRNWHVRYDVHEHPRGISAIVIDPTNHIKAVGFAKFNPRDEHFSVETGSGIALGRALAKIPHLTRRDLVAAENPPFRSGEKDPRYWSEQELARFILTDMVPMTTSTNLMRRPEPPERRDTSRSIADELF